MKTIFSRCWGPLCYNLSFFHGLSGAIALGVNAFYNPDDTTWYYWYEPSDMYLPVSYINDYPPAGNPGTNNNVRPNATSPLDGSLLPRN
jgi:hypothetical protein